MQMLGLAAWDLNRWATRDMLFVVRDRTQLWLGTLTGRYRDVGLLNQRHLNRPGRNEI